MAKAVCEKFLILSCIGHYRYLQHTQWRREKSSLTFSGSVPNPDPPDPHVFGPAGSGSISQRYGSGSFYHQKNSKKNLDSYYFVTSFGLLSLKNDENVPSKSNKQKNFFLNLFFVGVLKVNDENSRFRIH
jgi:hypothetical protein